MQQRKGRIVLIAAAMLALIALASPDRTASVEIHTHRLDDIAPRQVKAVLDLGVVAFSFLMTWSVDLRR